MSDNASNFGPFDAPLNDKVQLSKVGQIRAIFITLTNGNGVFHVTSVMLYMLKVKGLYLGQSCEDQNVHIKTLWMFVRHLILCILHKN